MIVAVSEEIAARENVLLSNDRNSKNADDNACNDAKQEITRMKSRRGRRHVKSARGLLLFIVALHC